MVQISQSTDFRLKYSGILDVIKDLPDKQRVRAENQFFLIKEYEDFAAKESKRLGKKFRKRLAIQDFCDFNGISHATLYRYMQRYRNGGIEALVSTYHRKSKGPVAETVLPIIREIVEPVKGYKPVLDKLVTICEQRGIKAPKYMIFRHIVISNGLADALVKKKTPQASSVEPAIVERRDETGQDRTHFMIKTPEWIRVVDKKAFNVAICKYCLVLPFLNPDLDRKKKNELIYEIVGRKHEVIPGVRLSVTRPSLLKYISVVKEKGFDGLIPKHRVFGGRTQRNTIWALFKIDINNPLACVEQVKEVIESNLAIPPHTKQISLRFLSHCRRLTHPSVLNNKGTRLDRSLTEEEIQKLNAYRTGVHKNHRNRATAILMANDNRTMLEILMAVGCVRQTVCRWLQKFKNEGIDFIKRKKDFTKNNEELRERKNRIIKILHHSPKDYGINRTAWIYKDVAKVYEREYGKTLSKGLIGRSIKETGYSWKSARRVLTSPDPEYRAKTKKVLDTLQNLGPNEAFFFIDEAGPWQVKKYGGKSLTASGTMKTFPQFQTPKGRVTFIGSLDAVKNQVTWFFTKGKDTDEVIRLIRILISEYHGYATLYLTWDCASWHRSKRLQKFLNEVNSNEEGPTVKVVPLPKQSQFLNVIESIFSGMKKAVIDNSDYQSEDEMKAAISRHFEERNEYFKENPKRAGKKIWDKEFFSLDEFESGLFKKM